MFLFSYFPLYLDQNSIEPLSSPDLGTGAVLG
jgi:hypothetical protein